MCQCIAQALPVSLRRGGGKAGDSLAPLLQLPGFNQEIIKKLRKRKINTVAGESTLLRMFEKLQLREVVCIMTLGWLQLQPTMVA